MSDAWRYAVWPDPRSRSGHEPLTSTLHDSLLYSSGKLCCTPIAWLSVASTQIVFILVFSCTTFLNSTMYSSIVMLLSAVRLQSNYSCSVTLHGGPVVLRPECWFAMCYSKAECSLRVVRAELDDGQRVIGVRFPPVLIAVAEKTAADVCLFVCLFVYWTFSLTFYLLILSSLLIYIYFLTYLLILPDLCISSIIGLFQFQAGGCRRRPNLALACWVTFMLYILLRMHVCFRSVRFGFSVLSREIGWDERLWNDFNHLS